MLSDIYRAQDATLLRIEAELLRVPEWDEEEDDDDETDEC